MHLLSWRRPKDFQFSLVNENPKDLIIGEGDDDAKTNQEVSKLGLSECLFAHGDQAMRKAISFSSSIDQ